MMNTADGSGAPARYRLALNVELMFPRELPHHDRLASLASIGVTDYGFWHHEGRDVERMLDVHHRHQLVCTSMTATLHTGAGTGLSHPGHEAAFLEELEATCEVAQRFGAPNLITFLGRRYEGEPADERRERIARHLRSAGDLAARYGLCLVLEPLNAVESPEMTMLYAEEAFAYACAAAHPHVKVDYDIYHRQLGEGNVLNGLRRGFQLGCIGLVEIGDVPGRLEAGTGEINYVNVFRFLREQGYAGVVGMEHGASTTPHEAWTRTRALAGLA